uniref:Uncharacterized protein n=1 Tax=Avena sativa TaxID=4498 RepID=A0ACD5X2L0_AVESA
MALARLTLVLLLVTLVVSATAAAADAGPAAGWMRPGPSSCGAMVEECLGEYRLRRRLNYDEEEEEEEDEGGDGGDYPTQTQYISYAALMRDSVPCSVPGASYYNCQPGADANPYSRGCSAITQCRG